MNQPLFDSCPIPERRKEARRETDCVRRDELSEIIHSAVQQALSSYAHKCVLNLSDTQRAEVHNIFNAIKEVGNGDIDVGIERIRDNHKMLARYCTVTGKIGTTVITSVVVLVLTFLGSSLLLGFIEKLKNAVKP